MANHAEAAEVVEAAETFFKDRKFKPSLKSYIWAIYIIVLTQLMPFNLFKVIFLPSRGCRGQNFHEV